MQTELIAGHILIKSFKYTGVNDISKFITHDHTVFKENLKDWDVIKAAVGSLPNYRIVLMKLKLK